MLSCGSHNVLVVVMNVMELEHNAVRKLLESVHIEWVLDNSHSFPVQPQNLGRILTDFPI